MNGEHRAQEARHSRAPQRGGPEPAEREQQQRMTAGARNIPGRRAAGPATGTRRGRPRTARPRLTAAKVIATARISQRTGFAAAPP